MDYLPLKMVSYATPPCIFSASKALLKDSGDAYYPQIVSIGPYHYGKEHLKGMERHKQDALCRELSRIQINAADCVVEQVVPDICILDQLVRRISSMEERIRRCYDKEINEYDYSLQMARDACFILEFFRCLFYESVDDDSIIEYGDFQILQMFHPIFGLKSDPFARWDIVKDLIRLENQIPLFVLEEILAMEMRVSLKNAEYKLQTMLRPVFQKIFYRPFECSDDGSRSRRPFSHILDIYHYLCLRDLAAEDVKDFKENKDRPKYPCPVELEKRQKTKFPSAVQLKKRGVKIHANAEKIEDVRFEGETLSIPPIKLDVDSEIFIRNLIALEICSQFGPLKRMTAFAQFMNELCQTEQGAAVMTEKGVIVGNVWQHSEVTRFFGSCKQSPLLPSRHPLEITRRKLIEYRSRNRRLSRAIVWNEFWNTSVSKPWLVIGGIGATMMLLLTAVQVFCLFKFCGAP